MGTYIVEVEVKTIRHVTVDAASVEAAETVGLREAMALVGGVSAEVVSIYSRPVEIVGGEPLEGDEE